MPARSIRSLVLAALLAALVPATAQAQEAPTLVGEVFMAVEDPLFGNFVGEISSSDAQCDPLGTSTFTGHASGVATGPFPGEFEETIHVTVGPQDITEANGEPIVAVGLLIEVEATFTIDSPLGQVSGTKTLDPQPFTGDDNFGRCIDDGEIGSVTYDLLHSDGFLNYEATMTVGSETFTERGLALHAFYEQLVVVPSPGEFDFSSFDEVFLSRTDVSTPGKAAGGGQVDDISFGFTAQSEETGEGDFAIKGECSVIEASTGTQVHCKDVTSYSQTGNMATFSGNGTIDGEPMTYRIDVTDNDESGIASDTFSIETSTGFSAGGVLTAGNVQVF